ncbi:hypothetical protein HED60_23840 [Planctomycetales bacterium ZRK34]|nr:hypothetical protein HED60_23840 [Planctomycetales bacterium ZRK34]
MSEPKLRPEFRDVLSEFINGKVEFLVVGAHAMAAHRQPRYTQDLDLWVRPVSENAERVWRALAQFGAPLNDLNITREDFCKPSNVIQVGLPPGRIDVICSITGVDFDEAWPNRIQVEVDGLVVPILGREQLIQNKQSTGRPKDQIDVELLTQPPQPPK